MSEKNLMSKTSKNPDVRTQANSGFAVYIGTKRVGWAEHKGAAIGIAKEALEAFPEHQGRFAPVAYVYDCSLILVVAFVTDDANGIVAHERNAIPTE